MLQNMKDLRVKSGLLSILVHFVLFLFLVVSLSWNSRESEPVMVELWSPVDDSQPSVAQSPKPEPKPQPKPEPKPQSKPEPKPQPKPEPKPGPKPEPKPGPKPEPKPGPERSSDIALKKKKREEQRKQAEEKKREEQRKRAEEKKREEQRRAKLIEERNKKRAREEFEQKKELERKLNSEKEKLADKKKLVPEDKLKDKGNSAEIKKTEMEREQEESKKRIQEEERRLAEIRRQREEERRLEELGRLRMIEELRRTKEEIKDTLETYNEDVRESEALQKKRQVADAAERSRNSELLEAELERYVDAIRRLVRDEWRWGGDATSSGLKVEFKLTVNKSGEVIGEPKLIKSSGNVSYDESVAKAIQTAHKKAGRLPVPKEESFYQSTFGRGLNIIFEF